MQPFYVTAVFACRMMKLMEFMCLMIFQGQENLYRWRHDTKSSRVVALLVLDQSCHVKLHKIFIPRFLELPSTMGVIILQTCSRSRCTRIKLIQALRPQWWTELWRCVVRKPWRPLAGQAFLALLLLLLLRWFLFLLLFLCCSCCGTCRWPSESSDVGSMAFGIGKATTSCYLDILVKPVYTPSISKCCLSGIAWFPRDISGLHSWVIKASHHNQLQESLISWWLSCSALWC